MLIAALYNGVVEPEFCDEFFYIALGRETTLSAHLFKEQGDLYGVNWLAVYCLALVNSRYFSSVEFKLNKSVMGRNKIFFSHEESILALTQQLAILGGSVAVKDKQKFVLESSKSLKEKFGTITNFAEIPEVTQDFFQIISVIEKYARVLANNCTESPESLLVTALVLPKASPRYQGLQSLLSAFRQMLGLPCLSLLITFIFCYFCFFCICF